MTYQPALGRPGDRCTWLAPNPGTKDYFETPAQAPLKVVFTSPPPDGLP